MTKKKPDSDKPKAAPKDTDSKQHIVLNKEDWEEVMKELRNPSPPSKALKELLRRKQR